MTRLKPGYLTLAGITVIGFFLRLYNLSAASIAIDEGYSFFAGKSFLAYKSFTMPSGYTYLSGWPHTFAVAVAEYVFGADIFSARLPSVIFGTICIPLLYLVGKKLFNKEIGTVAAVLYALNWYTIGWARVCRSYEMFSLSYLLLFYVFYILIEHRIDEKERIITILKWLFSFLCIFFISYQIRPLALHFIPVVVLGIALNRRKIEKRCGRKAIWIFMTSFTLAGLVYLLFINVMFFKYVISLLGEFAFATNYWSIKYLHFYLSMFHLFFVPFLILGIYWGWKAGFEKPLLYLLVSFFPPLILHSTIFARRTYDPRYIYDIMPFLMLLAAVSLYSLSERVARPLQAGRKKVHLGLCAALLLLVNIYGLSFKMPDILAGNANVGSGAYAYDNWKGAYQYVQSRMTPDDIIMSNMPETALFYLGKCDYWMKQGKYTDVGIYIDGDGNVRSAYHDTIMLNSYEKFMDVTFRGRSVWLIGDHNMQNRSDTDMQILNFIEHNFKLHKEVSSGEGIRVYSYQLKQPIPVIREDGSAAGRDDYIFGNKIIITDIMLNTEPVIAVSSGLQLAVLFKMLTDQWDDNLIHLCLNLQNDTHHVCLPNYINARNVAPGQYYKLVLSGIIPGTVSPGEYEIALTVAEGFANRALKLLTGKNISGHNRDAVHISATRLVSPRRAGTSHLCNPLSGNSFFLLSDMALAGYGTLRKTEGVSIELKWMALGEINKDYCPIIQLIKTVEGKPGKRFIGDGEYYDVSILPYLAMRDLIVTEDEETRYMPFGADSTMRKWRKNEMRRERYGIHVPEKLLGDYEVRMALVSEDSGTCSEGRGQSVKVEKENLYALTPHTIHRGKVLLSNENRLESLEWNLESEDLQEGKWVLDFAGKYNQPPDEERHFGLGVAVNGNEITGVPIPTGGTTEDSQAAVPPTEEDQAAVPPTEEDQAAVPPTEEAADQLAPVNRETGNMQESASPDQEAGRIMLDIPGIMLTGAKNKIHFLFNTRQENCSLVIEDIKLVNEKRIFLNDDNSIGLGKIVLGDSKGNGDAHWGDPDHVVTRVKEIPEWSTAGKEAVRLSDAVLLDYTYPELWEGRLCINLYWQINRDERLNPLGLQLINEESVTVFEQPLLTPYTTWLKDEILEEDLKLELPRDLRSGWYEVALTESENGKQVVMGKVRLKGSAIIEDYTCLTTRDYGKGLAQKTADENTPGRIVLVDGDVRGSRVSLKWGLAGGTCNSDLQFVVKVEGDGKTQTQRYFPQKPVPEWGQGEYYWEEYRLLVPEENNRTAYRVSIALWDPIRDDYVSLNGKKDFIRIGETTFTAEDMTEGSLISDSKSPFFFDETTLEGKIIKQLETLKVAHVEDLDLSQMSLELLKSYDVLVAGGSIRPDARNLLDEYVHAGGMLIESRDRPGENHVWELIKSEVR